MTVSTPSQDYLDFEAAMKKRDPKWFNGSPAAIGYAAWRAGHAATQREPVACSKHQPGACCAYDKLLCEVSKDKAAVEQALFDAANGKTLLPDQQRLRELALLLGHAGPLLAAHLASATPPVAVAAEDARPDEAALLDEIEQRLHHWRHQIGNEDGDHLGLLDLIGANQLDCLVDDVCAPFATPHPAPAVAAEAGQGEAAWCLLTPEGLVDHNLVGSKADCDFWAGAEGEHTFGWRVAPLFLATQPAQPLSEPGEAE